MLFGISINIWYSIVLGLVLVCLLLAGIVFVWSEFVAWKARRLLLQKIAEGGTINLGGDKTNGKIT